MTGMYAICVMTYQKENILCNYYVLLSHIQELEVMKYQDDNNDAINHMSNLKNVISLKIVKLMVSWISIN